jgi:hypothetical protein
MFIEEKIDRILALLEAATVTGEAPAAEPSKRGRKAKGEVNGVAVVPAAVPAATPAVTEVSASAASISPSDDPFADAAPAAPVATQVQMRAAILALRDATDQATALAVMKKYGAENFGAVKEADYGSIVRDATAALPAVKVVVDDPFADTATSATAPVASTAKSEATLDDVKKAIVQAQKRTSTDKVQQVVMDNGGVGVGANGAKGPSLKSLPADKYALVIDLIAKLPTTK